MEIATKIAKWLIGGWLKRRVKCCDCKFCEEDWLTSLNGHGLYKFNYCARLVHDLKVVEPEVKRKCGQFKKKVASRKASSGDVE